jgi:hypothetical protein
MVGIASALTAASTAAGDPSRPGVSLSLAFGVREPASATAMELRVSYRDPANPGGKPSPLRKSVLQAPAGTVFDTRAIPACTATDVELLAVGPAACPAESVVGHGTVALETGFGSPFDPFGVVATLFNSGTGVTELFSDAKTGTRLAVGHAEITEPGTLTEEPAPNPGGPPDGESSVREVEFRFDLRHGSRGRAFITSPPVCPVDRLWRSRIAATVADGHTYTAEATTPCAAPAAARPAIRVAARPQQVPRGRTVRVRVRLSSTDRRCVVNAVVRLARARARTGFHGVATLVVRLNRKGAYVISASARGCQAGKTTVIAGS